MSIQKNLKVLVVDDSTIYRMVMRKALAKIPDITVIGAVANGIEALKAIEDKSPDLVMLDLEMPVMNGIETLKEIKKRGLKVGVVIVSGTDMRSGNRTMLALQHGAFDFIVKPMAQRGQDGAALLRGPLKLTIGTFRSTMKHVVPKRAPAAPHALTQTSFRPVAAPKPQSPARKPPSKCRALVIGISTGGPAALTKVMPSIVANFPIPIFIVQHMPAGFTAYFAESLNKACALRVSEAKEGQKVSAGDIVIAPGGYHMEVRAMGGQASVHLTEDAPENACRPAVDVLFRSAAKVYGSQLLSVIMTGMGKDGLAGVGDVRKAGGYCLIQESSSCAVYGMPRAVEEAGLADEVVLIEQIAGRIQTLAGGRLRRSA